ncbi:Beta-agarase [Catenovulum agarivorans DS-2]|uniref:Beta-agarase n=1 Tax=Catenovulum agarivorans DS-2 TaxID=1328313 RepID=W7QVH3_9ALTE|nr:hypothetical protein [Catenovulum agarivorans]EWH11718.1 Beta-agarase [Catenovulum agarivorans DS-2]
MNKYQDELLASFIAGEDNRAELQQEWEKDPQFKQKSARHVLTHRLMQVKLKQHDSAEFSDEIMARIKQQKTTQQANLAKVSHIKRYWFQGTSIAASIFLCALIWFSLEQPNQPFASVKYQPVTSEVQVSELEAFQLSPGPFQMLSGQAHIQFNNGTKITASSPTHLDIKSASNVRIIQGQLAVDLPANSPAFYVQTASANYVIAQANDRQVSALANSKEADVTPIYRQENLPFSFTIDAQGEVKTSGSLDSIHKQSSNEVESIKPKSIAPSGHKEPQQQDPAETNNHSNTPINIVSGLNMGFETGDLTHWLVDVKSLGFAEVTPEAAKSGNYGLHINTMNSGPVFIKIKHSVLPAGFVKKHKQYKLSYDIKRLTDNAESAIGYTRFNNSFNAKYQTTAHGPWFRMPRDNTWQHHEKIIHGQDWPDTFTFVEIAFWTPNEEWYLDNVELVEIPPAENFIKEQTRGFESGALGTGLTIQREIGQENFAILQVTEEAAIDGNYGLYANSTTGEMHIKFTSDAFITDQINNQTDYLFAYDLRVVEGKAALRQMPNTGGIYYTPEWAGYGYQRGIYWVDNDGLIRVRIKIPAEKIPEDGRFEMKMLMKEGAVVHFDNFEFSAVTED